MITSIPIFKSPILHFHPPISRCRLFQTLPHLQLTNLSNGRRNLQSLTITCNIKVPQQESTKKEKPISEKIFVTDAAPPLEDGGEEALPPPPTKVSGTPVVWLKKVPKKVLSILSNLPLAIGEMATIAALMALGTVIDQGEAPEYYFEKFPEDNPVFGIFTWRWILTFGFDHMFSSPVFLGLMVLLAASLMACTYTTQIPMVKVARRWSYLHSAKSIRKQEFSDVLPKASVQDLGVILMGAGYEVFLKGPCLYAFKGLAGRFAPIGVHLAMLLIMGGATLSATGSFKGYVTVPQGLNFVVGDAMNPNGFLSNPTKVFNTEVHVNRFSMDYYDSGEVSQFHSDLSLFDIDGKEVLRKTISVNDPLRYGGITIYQTDWSISALQVMKDDEGPFNLAMAPLKVNGDKKLYGTFLPVGNTDSQDVKGISMLARDLQSIVLYDQSGKFVGVRRPSSKLPIEIDGSKIVIVDAIGSTGLNLKTDPGVPIVYAGFGALMLTTCISYLSHSQIWALQDGTTVVVGGKTNRAKLEFPEEVNRLLDCVPDLFMTLCGAVEETKDILGCSKDQGSFQTENPRIQLYYKSLKLRPSLSTMDLDEDRLGLLLVRVSELRSKIANCIARENPAAGEARSREQLKSNGFEDSSNASIEGDEESENLFGICEAFDSLECQLGSLQSLQQQQEYQRADAITEIERSRKKLLKKLTEYEGEYTDVIKEASAFASLKVDNNNELLLPPYPSHTSHPLVLDNGHVPLLSYGTKLSQNGHGSADVTNGLNKSESEKPQTFLGRSWTGLRFLISSAAKSMVTIVAVMSVLKMAGLETRIVSKGTVIQLGGRILKQNVTEEKKLGSITGCPPGRVAIVEDGKIRCIVKERIEIPFDSVKSSPDVEYGCG
ncbi:hypothetical protein V2J09_002123 [Rumex salicifolius]